MLCKQQVQQQLTGGSRQQQRAAAAAQGRRPAQQQQQLQPLPRWRQADSSTQRAGHARCSSSGHGSEPQPQQPQDELQQPLEEGGVEKHVRSGSSASTSAISPELPLLSQLPGSADSSAGALQQQPQDAAAAAVTRWPPVVPWGMGTLGRVLGLWLVAYIALGQLVLPGLLVLLDIERAALSARGQALLNLAVDVCQVVLTCAMLQRCLARYQPRAAGLFRVAWDGGRWLVWVAAGVACFPVIDWFAAESTALLLGTSGPPAIDVVSAQVELGLYTRDWVTTSAYALILSLCAPLWEELLFRGFLLPSLAKRWPPGGAAAGSALVFALLHSQTETFAPLVLVGLACGWLYVGTHNLLPSMVYHGLWNLYVMGSMGLQMHAGCEARTASLGLGAAMAAAVLAAAGLAAIPRWLRAAAAGAAGAQEQEPGQAGGSSSAGEQPSAAGT